MHTFAKPMLILATVLGGFAIAAPALAQGGLTLHINEGQALHLSGAAAQVVVSNPSIADASIVSRHELMLLGRSYGSTALTVIDGAGRTIYDGNVTVAPAQSNHVSLYRGVLVNNFTCASRRCERTPMPGEIETDYKAYAEAYKDYGDRAKGASAGQGGTP